MTVFLLFSFLFGFHGDRFPTFSFLFGFHGVCFPTFSFLYGFHAIPIILLIMLINLLGHITYCYYLLYHVINTLPKKKTTRNQSQYCTLDVTRPCTLCICIRIKYKT